jgi:hypothetical protein
MKFVHGVAYAVCLFGLLAACNKKSEAETSVPGGGRCSYETEGRCEEYKDSALGMHETICRGTGGSYTKAACARDKLLGTCAREAGVTEFVYLDNTLNLLADDGKARCERGVAKGTWTADPAGAARKTVELADVSKVRASCMYEPQEGRCSDFVTPDVMNLHKQGCEARHGKFAAQACARVGLAGTCAQGGGRLEHYYAAAVTAPALALYQKQCETEMMGQRGHWVVGSEPPHVIASSTASVAASVVTAGKKPGTAPPSAVQTATVSGGQRTPAPKP